MQDKKICHNCCSQSSFTPCRFFQKKKWRSESTGVSQRTPEGTQRTPVPLLTRSSHHPPVTEQKLKKARGRLATMIFSIPSLRELLFPDCDFCWNCWSFGFHRFPIILCTTPNTALLCSVLFLNDSSTGACLCVNDLFLSCLLFWIKSFFYLLSCSWRENFSIL